VKSNNISYYRLLIIDREISKSSYPSSQYLANKCEVSVPTIKRDIRDLKLLFHAPLQYSKKNNGYFYLNKTFRLPGMLTSAQNIKIAASVCNFLDVVKGSPYYNDTLAFFEELSTVVPQFDISGNREYEREALKDKIKTNIKPCVSDNLGSKILFLGAPHTIINKQVWYSILRALEKQNIISFDYRGYNDKRPIHRVVYPYQLIFDDGEWSLFCFVPKKRETRLFNLSKIQKIDVLDSTFDKKDDVDFKKLTEGVFGRYIENKYESFEILLKGYSAEYSRNRIFSTTQKIVRKDNGDIIISFRSNQYAPIKAWVLKQGANSIPLKPKRLVDDWKNEIIKMYKNL